MSQTARALVIVALASASAHAEPSHSQAPAPRPWTGYIRVPQAAPPGPASAVSSRIFYVKKCIAGCDVHYDPIDDSRTGASSIVPVSSTRTIGPFTQTNEVWVAMMDCVKTTF
ncbi:MAG TPA: hypothetical protein VIV40_34390, partial [Kofleriaceae bacterium]